MKFTVYGRFGKAHGHYAGEVIANSLEEAFGIAVRKFFQAKHYKKYTSFYVAMPYSPDGSIRSYGYDKNPLYHVNGIFSSSMSIIDNALLKLKR